jgi:hypothetical protein
MTKPKYLRKCCASAPRASSFFRHSSFVIFLGSPHPRNLWKCQDAAEDFLARRVCDLMNSDRLSDIETTGFCAPQRFQVRAATELFADVVDIGANVKTFAAKDAEIDFRRRNSIYAVTIDMNEARLALNHFSLARKFVERYAAMFFCRDHRRHLMEIAAKFFKGGANLILIEWWHVALSDDFALSILRGGRHAEQQGPRIFLVFAHEQILNFRPAPKREQEQTGGDRIEGAAMADFLDPELSPDQRYHVVRSHPLCFIDKQDAVRSGI